MFIEKFSAMMDHIRTHEYFPSHNRMKQLKACWIERINTLNGVGESIERTIMEKY
jgi:hypothetical protein